MPARRPDSRTPILRLVPLTLVASAFLSGCSDSPVEPRLEAGAGGPAAGPLTSATGGRFVPGRVLVRFRSGANELAAAGAQGAILRATVAHRVRLLEVPVGNELAIARALGRRADVEAVLRRGQRPGPPPRRLALALRPLGRPHRGRRLGPTPAGDLDQAR